MAAPAEADFLYRCDPRSGWRLLDEGKPRLITARAGHFLPTIIEFLRRRPTLRDTVFVVLQVRLFREGQEFVSGSLLLLQEGIRISGEDQNGSGQGSESPRLLAPASYVEDKYRRISEVRDSELDRLQRMLGPTLASKAIDSLSTNGWSYDLVLELRHLDERVESIGGNGEHRAFISARVKAVMADAGASLAERLWRPGVGVVGSQSLKDSVCIPWIPPSQRMRAEALGRCVVYLTRGGPARQVLRDMNQVWQRPSTRNVLLAAEPGSGKEVVSRLLHFGRAAANFVSSSVGGESWESWQTRLLGQGQQLGPPILKGFIDDAIGGTLLVDEIDKADRRIRDALLRIIEADEFYRPGSSEAVRFGGERRPLFIFAGSGNGEEARRMLTRFSEAQSDQVSLKQIWAELGLNREPKTALERMMIEPPRDFWQRMDRRLSFRHPLGDGEDWDREAFLQYVDLFLWRAREGRSRLRETPFAADRLLVLQHKVTEGAMVSRLWPSLVAGLAEAIIDLNGESMPSFREIRSAASEFYDHLWSLGRSGQLRQIRKGIPELALAAVKRSQGEEGSF